MPLPYLKLLKIELLSCIKEFIQSESVNDIQNKTEGSFFGISAAKVTDVSNLDQLEIFVHKIMKKLLEFVQCDNIEGESKTEFIINALNDACFNPRMYRTQTFDEVRTWQVNRKMLLNFVPKQKRKAPFSFTAHHTS